MRVAIKWFCIEKGEVVRSLPQLGFVDLCRRSGWVLSAGTCSYRASPTVSNVGFGLMWL